jgi:hypothetical protein
LPLSDKERIVAASLKPGANGFSPTESRSNRKLKPLPPDPARHQNLTIARLVASGLTGFVENSVEVSSIIRSVRLPAFDRSRHKPFAWPQSR